jgi:uncharacterized protein
MKRKPSLYNIIIAVILILIILIGSLVLFTNPEKRSMRKPAETIKQQPEQPSKPVFRKDGNLRFLKSGSNKVITDIEIEVANDDGAREQGLMYRDTMAENAGMLFMMETEELQAFWMKNTIISLDILFVNSERRIVSIHKNCTPYSLDQIQSEYPALYVVEVNAGYTEKHGIQVGDYISF